MSTNGGQTQFNDALWARDLVVHYSGRGLRPVEQQILDTYAADLSGRVLELGCGAGRITRRLVELADAVVAIDVSGAMVEATREQCPSAEVLVADLRDLSAVGVVDAVIGGDNVIDVLAHESRLDLLRRLHAMINPGGLLVLSSHNYAMATPRALRLSVLVRGRRHLPSSVLKMPRWWWNRHQRRQFEYRGHGHGVLNDVSHDYEALHYYVTRDEMARQLADADFELVSCLDLSGVEVPAGGAGTGSMELHYVARRV